MIELLLPELGVKITITIEKYPPPMPPFFSKYSMEAGHEQRNLA